MWRQFQDGGGQGGMDVQVTDANGNFHQAAWNLQDTAGQYINYMTAQNQWVNRTVDLSSFANDVVSVYLLFVNDTTPAGSNFDIYHSNIAIVSADGTVTTLYAGQRGTSIPLTYNYGNNGSNLAGVQETVNAGAGSPGGTTLYYHGDHLGSARMMTWAGGWPVSSDTYHPFGLEPAGASDTNHYRYASLERDAESGFDHADFRQLASSQGRWFSPDPSDGSYDTGNPQSFNRYAYVLNNPLSYTDPLGLTQTCNNQGCIGTCDPDQDNCVSSVTFAGPPPPSPDPVCIFLCTPVTVVNPVVPPSPPGVSGTGPGGTTSGNPAPSNGIVKQLTPTKYSGCAVVAGGKLFQSFLGLPPGFQNGPPGPSTILRAVRGGVTAGAPAIGYAVQKVGGALAARFAEDAIPVVGEVLLAGQATLAAYDAVKTYHQCTSGPTTP